MSTTRRFGGTYPVTATLTNVLAAKQIFAPHTGKPFSEAMILGVSGGLGMGYILWEFQEHRMEHNSLFEAIELQGAPGGLRGMYSELPARRSGHRGVVLYAADPVTSDPSGRS